MIEFHCKSCNKKLRVPKARAGEKGRCPKCKNIVVVPQPQIPASEAAGDTSAKSQNGNFEFTFLDGPPKQAASAEPAAAEDGIAADLPTMYTGRTAIVSDKTTEAPKRKLPWPVDIFLYPTNTAGLTIIGILIGVPLVISLILKVLGRIASGFPPLLVFVAFLWLIGLLINIVLCFYMLWYFCECIRDSAAGGLRAPETLAKTPGIFEMFWQLLKVIVCLLFFFLPAGVYAYRVGRGDLIFWALLFYGVFFFPMGLLAMIMFDSVSGLNPILLIGSIFSTLLPYCGLVLFFLAFSVFVVRVAGALYGGGVLQQLPGLRYFSAVIGIYLFMVGSHLLGRFYWRYRERLNWEV